MVTYAQFQIPIIHCLPDRALKFQVCHILQTILHTCTCEQKYFIKSTRRDCTFLKEKQSTMKYLK